MSRAIKLATDSAPIRPVVISDESFTEDLRFLNLDAGLRVLGGFQRVTGTSWQRGCRGPSVFNTPSPVGLIVENSASLALSDLYVQAASANSSGLFGGSSFGAAINNATVTLTNMTLRAGNGGDGGSPLSPSPPTAASCAVVTSTTVVVQGAGGADGGPGGLGTFGVADYQPVQAPPGGRGLDGGTGTAGGLGTTLSGCAGGCSCAGSTCNTGTRMTVQSLPGLAGCGGTGGLPGQGGGGGGASVGLLVTGASQVVLERSFVRSGAGGNGALGAAGASGAAGSTGQMGANATCWANCTGDCGNGGANCGAGYMSSAGTTVPGGTPGSQGGTGGRGGAGGPGAGGPSYGIVTVGTSVVLSSDAGVSFGLGGGWGGDPVRRAPAAPQVGF